MKTQIIQLESHDDLISARDKIAWSKAPRILLVWPHKGRVLERPLDMLELQRHAKQMGAQLGVVANSAEARQVARELGIPVFESPAQAQKKSWRRTRGRNSLDRGLLTRKIDVAALRQTHNQMAKMGKLPILGRIGAFSLGVLAIFALLLFFLPSARLDLTPQRQDQTLALTLRASPEITTANPAGGMPVVTVSVVVEGSDQLPSTGSASVPDLAAVGYVEFSNLSDMGVKIPLGTVIATLDNPPLRYETTDEGSLQAGIGKKTSLAVRALIPGREGNVPAGSLKAIEGTIGLQAEVTNPGSMYGGADRISPSPTQEDYAALRVRLLETLSKTAQVEMLKKLSKDQRLLAGTVKIGQVQKELANPPVKQPGDYAGLTMQVEYTAWSVREADLMAIARTALEANRPAGFVPLNSTVDVTFIGQAEPAEDGAVTWKAQASRQLEADWNNQTAARMVVGMRPEKASQALQANLRLARPAAIVIQPGWWFRMPFLSFRVLVVRQ